jgi:hypothetical protein
MAFPRIGIEKDGGLVRSFSFPNRWDWCSKSPCKLPGIDCEDIGERLSRNGMAALAFQGKKFRTNVPLPNNRSQLNRKHLEIFGTIQKTEGDIWIGLLRK